MEGVDGDAEAEPEPEEHSETIEKVLGIRRGKKGGSLCICFYILFIIILHEAEYFFFLLFLHFGANTLLNFS